MSCITVANWSRSRYAELLRATGLRPTRQRVMIAELLFGKGDRHLTAETLFEEARNLRYPPSLATIYNALKDFAAHGLVREIALYGAKLWYDTKTGPHFHYYVEGEDDLRDIPEEMIPALDIAPPPGMRIVGVDVVIRLVDERGERSHMSRLRFDPAQMDRANSNL
jgi:Fur family transcriptional regulator, iron response regulator